MRKRLPQIGDTRIKSWYALIPVTINNERRWLEKVTVEQEYAHNIVRIYDLPYPTKGWFNLRFVEEE